MNFDELDDDVYDVCDFSDVIVKEFAGEPDRFTMESIDWHTNIFKFVNPNNILYIPDQHYLI